MTTSIERASRSVIDLHVQIEALFNGDSSQLPELLSQFDDDFLMVTPTGKTLTFQEVASLFEQLTGARQGMTISIEQFRTIGQMGSEVVMQYVEHQVLQGKETRRISLAVIDCAHQPPRWRYLQETMTV